jgi:phage FluMu protein Com
MNKVTCAACGKDTGRSDTDPGAASEPCPHCSSLNPIRISEREDVQVKEWLKGRKKDNARRSKDKVRQEFIVGDELNHSTGKWIKKDWCIDRDEKTYREIITDHDTGEVIHTCEKPLPDHRGTDPQKPIGKDK